MVELKILGGFQTLAVFICFHQFTQGQGMLNPNKIAVLNINLNKHEVYCIYPCSQF